MVPYFPFLEAAYMAKKCGGGGVIKPLTVTQNGQYNAPEGVDGFNPVEVKVASSSTNLIDNIKKFTKIAELDILEGYKVVFSWDPELTCKLGYSPSTDSWASGKYSYLSRVYFDSSIWGSLYHGDVLIEAYRVYPDQAINQYANNYDGSLGPLYETVRYANIKVISGPTFTKRYNNNFFEVDMTISRDSILTYVNTSEQTTYNGTYELRYTPSPYSECSDLDPIGYALEMQAILKLLNGF